MRAPAMLPGDPGSRTPGGRSAGKALQRTVEQRHVGNAAVGRQRGNIDGEAVVLRRDQHLFGIEVLHRVVRAVVAGISFSTFWRRKRAP